MLPQTFSGFCSCARRHNDGHICRSKGRPGKFKISFLLASKGSQEPGAATGGLVEQSHDRYYQMIYKKVAISHDRIGIADSSCV
ncbi:hypothetical protein GDO78_015050 [Eleutherodactylus coqui]|uniref:Uncharacterized protein n=1 Tax=Eleutherodactylus coqui TaxID=57060 RepID=A0A8J6E6J3_ELECQ|nr:hypothetical protein GDO78_015050 [Eleutherodactylus coqui]